MRFSQHPNTIINRDANGSPHGYVEIWQIMLNNVMYRGTRWHGAFVRYNDWFNHDGYVGVVEYFIT
jgi:hypothetical protein